MTTRVLMGRSAMPGYGRVRWTAQQTLSPDGGVLTTALRTAILTSGDPLSDAGRIELVF